MNIFSLLEDNNFFRTIFNVIPVTAMIMDEQGRVFKINETASYLFDVDYDYQAMKSGTILQCINRNLDEEGCGYSRKCCSCVIKKTASQALSGSTVHRAKGKVTIEKNNMIFTMSILVSSAPLVYQGKNYAVTIIEDVSEVTELQGLIPICAHCLKIRDDEGYWRRIEKYIEDHSEAEFTHDICPKCTKEIISDAAKYVKGVSMG